MSDNGFFVSLLAGGLRATSQKYYNLLLGPVGTPVPWDTFGVLCFLECGSLLFGHVAGAVRSPMM